VYIFLFGDPLKNCLLKLFIFLWQKILNMILRKVEIAQNREWFLKIFNGNFCHRSSFSRI